MKINFMNFVENLRYMGIGMLGIFAVICIIIAAVAILSKITNKNQ